jgi:hypothetical protein
MRRRLVTRLGQPFDPKRDCVNDTCPGCKTEGALVPAGWSTAWSDEIKPTVWRVMIRMVYATCRICPVAVFDYSEPVGMVGYRLPEPEDGPPPPKPPDPDAALCRGLGIGFRQALAVACHRARLDKHPFTDWPDAKSPEDGLTP